MLLAILAFSGAIGPTSPPGETVLAFYRAANRAAYEEAQGFWAPENAKALAGGVRAFCDDQTSGRTLEKVEVLKQEVRGDLAEVRVELYFSAGLALHRGSLVRRNGVWKIWALES
jgi:hypothetical protein